MKTCFFPFPFQYIPENIKTSFVSPQPENSSGRTTEPHEPNLKFSFDPIWFNPVSKEVATRFDSFSPRVESTPFQQGLPCRRHRPPAIAISHPCSPPENRVRCYPKPHPPVPLHLNPRGNLPVGGSLVSQSAI
jgi:hypothetical protein